MRYGSSHGYEMTPLSEPMFQKIYGPPVSAHLVLVWLGDSDPRARVVTAASDVAVRTMRRYRPNDRGAYGLFDIRTKQAGCTCSVCWLQTETPLLK